MGGSSPIVTRVSGLALLCVTGWVGQKRQILALRNYAMPPNGIGIITGERRVEKYAQIH